MCKLLPSYSKYVGGLLICAALIPNYSYAIVVEVQNETYIKNSVSAEANSDGSSEASVKVKNEVSNGTATVNVYTNLNGEIEEYTETTAGPVNFNKTFSRESEGGEGMASVKVEVDAEPDGMSDPFFFANPISSEYVIWLPFLYGWFGPLDGSWIISLRKPL